MAETTAKTPILKAQNLGIQFGGLKAVDDFNIEIGQSELVGLIGPNGAGKTTVFNLITGVYKPTEGSFYLCGERMNGKKTHQIVHAGIARTFQNIRLFKKMTVIENVKAAMQEHLTYGIPQAIFRTPKYWAEEAAATKRAKELLEVVHLSGKEDLEADNLPYGQQRRLEIAPRPGHRHEAAASGRAGRRHEPHRDRGTFGDHRLHPGCLQGVGAADRARHEPGDEDLRAHPGAGFRHHHQPQAPRPRWPTIPASSRPTWANRERRRRRMLEVKDLKVSYGAVQALDGVSLTVSDGEIVSLIGANGAGKTTALRTITGLEKAAAGSIVFDGHDLRKTEPSRIIGLKLAHVPEGRHIFPEMTVEENLEMGAYADPAGREETMQTVYARFPRLKERRRQLAGTLSGEHAI